MNQKQEKRLAADGAYGQYVNGYQGDGKARFLRDSRAMLKATARHLAARGLTASDIRLNPGGVAVSGEASAHYWNPDEAGRRVYASLGAMALGWGRHDQLIVLARVETFVEEVRARRRATAGWRCAGMGPNQWLSANLNALELAEALRALLAPGDHAGHDDGRHRALASANPSPDRDARRWR